jgi:signal transduction histidine kinase/ABC-type uncharacterized transport system substrate-binding protein
MFLARSLFCAVGLMVVGVGVVGAQPNGQTRGQSSARQSVLIVLPDPPGRPLSDAVLDGIQAELTKQQRSIAVSADYISHVGKDRPEYEKAQLNWFRNKYAGIKFDVIIAVGPQALEALLDLRNDLWPNVPIVWCAVDPDNASKFKSQPAATGVFLDLQSGMTQRTALKMLPNSKHLAFVGGSSPMDRYFNGKAIEFIKQSGSNLDVIDLTGLTIEELKRRLSQLPPDTFAIVNSYFYDPAGRPMFQRDLIEAISPISNAPIFDGSEFSIGLGTVGGYLHHYESVGEEGASLAVRVLNGEDPSRIPIARTHAASFQFDWRQLQRWKIPLDRLPPGSQVRFREVPVWERYRGWIAGILLFAMLESALLAVLLIARRKGKRSEALNRAILGSLPGQIFIIDRDATIIRSSHAEDALPAKALAGGNYRQCWTNAPGVAQEDAARIRAAITRVLTGEMKHPVLEFPHSSRDRDQWTEIRMEALDRPEGGAVISHLDITASKNAEVEARRSKEEMLHLNRIASMGELAASLAHELNQPLAGILTNAQGAVRFMAQQPPNYSEVEAALADIQDDGTRAGEVIRKMRNMLKTGRAQAIPLNLNEVAEEAVALLLPDARLRKISIVMDLDPRLPRMEGDTIQLQQVIMNLVLNAMEATHTVGQIEVRTRLSAEGGSSEISVTDNGPGIPAESLSRVFQPFFSTKSDGLGMGLSISRSIVEAHGGTIAAENVPGSGATFRVSFPTRQAVTA